MLLGKTTKCLGHPLFEHFLFPFLVWIYGWWFGVLPNPILWLAITDWIIDGTQDIGEKLKIITIAGWITGVTILLYAHSHGFLYLV
jgi:hypothetical protein